MPNQIDSTGLQVKTVQEIIDSLIADFQAIYGSDINVDQNSPDGQIINIQAQAIIDQLELLVQVYNSFDPDFVFGVLCDQRFALNGLARQAGTYTIQPVDVTVDRALSLNGLDALILDPTAQVFTVQDDAGNKFFLEETHAFGGAGTTSLAFRAEEIGQVQTTINTIVNVVTVTLGVTGVNNSAPATIVGENEETDAEMKIRHARSFNLAAVGPADSVLAAILAANAVSDAYVAENVTGGTVAGVPAHSIWTIVEGGTDADVGQAIYSKKGPGCGMRGAVTVDIARPNGTTFTAKFDRPIQEDLYIKLTLVPKRAGITFDTDVIKADLVAALKYKIAQSANIGDVVVAMLSIAPDGICSTLGVSDDGMAYVDILDTTDFQHKFVLDAARIDVTV